MFQWNGPKKFLKILRVVNLRDTCKHFFITNYISSDNKNLKVFSFGTKQVSILRAVSILVLMLCQVSILVNVIFQNWMMNSKSEYDFSHSALL